MAEPTIHQPTVQSIGGVSVVAGLGGQGFLMFAKEMEWHLPHGVILLIGALSVLALIISGVIYLRLMFAWTRGQLDKPHPAFTQFAAAVRRRLIPLMLGAMGLAGIVLIVGAIAGYFALNQPATAIAPDPKIAELTNERDGAIRDRDNARQQLASRPAPQTDIAQPVAPKRDDPAEKAELKGLMISISKTLNTEGVGIFRGLQRYIAGKEDGVSPGAQESFDLIKDAQGRTQALYERIFRKIIPENKYFERDLKFIVGEDDPKTNPPYQLIQQLGTYFGQLNMVLVLIPKMKDDSTRTTERQLLGMADESHHIPLRVAITNFEKWITQCNERIDEKTR
jgi:hypothetical protein